MASLFVIQGRDQGKRIEIDRPLVGLGRDHANLLQLHDKEVSRNHAEIRLVNDKYVLSDLHSSNGTFVNSQPITEHVLANGDRVQVGKTLLIFTRGSESSGRALVDEVDIVGRESSEGSRIVKSIRKQESAIFAHSAEGSESPWLARARSNLQIMYRTALAVSHTLDIDQLLQRIMELIFEWVEADRGCIMLVDPETDELMPKVSRHRRQVRGEQKERLSISRTILDYVLEQKEGVLTSDAREDQRWDPAASIVRLGVREAICVPMQGRYGIVGVIYIDTYTPPGRDIQRTPNKFSEEHLKLMVAIGHQAALAVEDTSYYSAMVQAERLAAMGQTIATLSHHVKNILQGVRGGSYLIEEGLKGGDFEIVRKGWKIVERNQDKISHLVLDMLTFSKERQPDLMPAKLNDLMADVAELMQVRADEAGVELIVRPQSELPDLMFDADLMHRAVLNVVTNAIDACEKRTPARVTLTAALDPTQQLACVRIDDTGEGISEENRVKVFSLFESRKGNRGTGLGLPVSRKILREHGGDIRLESELGVGSSFFLEFPAIFPTSSGNFGNSETIELPSIE
jgi:signal transduction histidine kinase